MWDLTDSGKHEEKWSAYITPRPSPQGVWVNIRRATGGDAGRKQAGSVEEDEGSNGSEG
jgi:hypothetical protein